MAASCEINPPDRSPKGSVWLVTPEPVDIFCGELDPLDDDDEAGTIDAVIDGGGAATEMILFES